MTLKRRSGVTSVIVIPPLETMSIHRVLVCVFFCSQVHRVLPQWLAQPDVIHRDIKGNLVPISDITGLSAPLVKKLQHNGIQHFFPGEDKLQTGWHSEYTPEK